MKLSMKGITISVLVVLSLALSGCGDSGGPETPDWNAVIANYQDTSQTVVFLDIARLNLALAETGQLADRAFAYKQVGPGGLVPEWGQKPEAGALLSDIFFSMGHIALSQRYAFETFEQGDPRFESGMLARLVQTNLIYGNRKVAEKYLSRLEQEKNWKVWVRNQRMFMDEDPVLAFKRGCLPPDDFLSETRGLDEDLKDIVRANPGHKSTIEYLGVLYLLECDFDGFRGMLDEFLGTEALPALPVSFSEAVCMMSELEPGYWKEAGCDEGIYRRFIDFKKRLEAGRSLDRYSHTYWYYVMKVNSL